MSKFTLFFFWEHLKPNMGGSGVRVAELLSVAHWPVGQSLRLLEHRNIMIVSVNIKHKVQQIHHQYLTASLKYPTIILRCSYCNNHEKYVQILSLGFMLRKVNYLDRKRIAWYISLLNDHHFPLWFLCYLFLFLGVTAQMLLTKMDSYKWKY